MRAADIPGELTHVLFDEAAILKRIDEVARDIDRDYAGKVPLLVGVLNGAIMTMADLSRALTIHCETDWMAVSSYGAATKSSGVVRILKDLSADIHGRDVIIIEDIIDTGLTLQYLMQYLEQRGPASVEIFAMFRKPEAFKCDVACKYVGYDLPDEFVVGYGLDYAGKYRNLRDCGTLSPSVYS